MPVQAWGLRGLPHVSQKLASGAAAARQRGQAANSNRPQLRQKAAPFRLFAPQCEQIVMRPVSVEILGKSIAWNCDNPHDLRDLMRGGPIGYGAPISRLAMNGE